MYFKKHNSKINVPNTSRASKFTKTEAQKLHIKDELKFLYIKKQNLKVLSYFLYFYNSFAQ